MPSKDRNAYLTRAIRSTTMRGSREGGSEFPRQGNGT